jgi:hypothetical protein
MNCLFLFDEFIAHLTTFSLAHTMWRRMAGRSVNNEIIGQGV